MRRIHVFVEGRVQGVWFRETTRRTAVELKINGWVRNVSDGRVEVCAEGENDAIDKFICYLNRGPQMACVMNVSLLEERYTGEFQSFVVQPSEGV